MFFVHILSLNPTTLTPTSHWARSIVTIDELDPSDAPAAVKEDLYGYFAETTVRTQRRSAQYQTVSSSKKVI